MPDPRLPSSPSWLRRTGRFGWPLLVALVTLAAATLTRVVLIVAGGVWAAASPASLARAILAGAAYDALVALWVALPWAAAVATIPPRGYARLLRRRLRRGWLAATVFGVLFVAAAEVVFFDEFTGRFNFVAVDYLIYPTEVASNIWQSYPLVPSLLALALATAGVMRLLRPVLRRLDDAPALPLRRRLAVAGAHLGVVAALSALVPPSLARVSDDRVLNEVAANGYYTFVQALRGRDAPYDGLYATRPDGAAFERLRVQLHPPRRAGGAPARLVGRIERRLNVVVVLEESLGSQFVGALHPRDSASLTPSLDSLAREGTLLTRAYSTGNRTIRALEATTASIPPLPGISIVRRPRSVDLFTLPNVLRARGYATEFVYGGRALFDGMGAYMRHNGVERVVEQGDYPRQTFSTAWGVADEAIFDRALAEMDSLHATGKPFYTLVLTVSNHRPYTYPAGRIAQDPLEHRRTYAVRYADWALGRFMRAARSHAFFGNTLFVLMGDHGARVYGAAEIPLPSYEVPIVFYAPGFIPAGRRVDAVASSLDVPPTILSLLGVDVETKFFGRDVLGGDPSAPGRALMTHNSDIALLRGGRLAVLGLRGRTDVFDVDSAGALRRVRVMDAAAAELVEDAIAYYQGADHLYRSGGYAFAADRTRSGAHSGALVTAGR